MPLLEKAFRLNPVSPPFMYYLFAAHAYRLTGWYEDAIRMCKKILARWPNNFLGHAVLVLCYVAMGREDEAHAAAREVLRVAPKFSVRRYVRLYSYKDPEPSAQVLKLMRKAGLSN